MKKYWFLKIAFFVPAIIALVTFVTMSLWNWLIPVLFQGPLITFWQALGLLLLSKILFGFHGKRGGPPWRHHWRRRWEEKMKHMSPEQREELRKKWQERCGWRFPQEESKPTGDL